MIYRFPDLLLHFCGDLLYDIYIFPHFHPRRYKASAHISFLLFMLLKILQWCLRRQGSRIALKEKSTSCKWRWFWETWLLISFLLIESYFVSSLLKHKKLKSQCLLSKIGLTSSRYKGIKYLRICIHKHVHRQSCDSHIIFRRKVICLMLPKVHLWNVATTWSLCSGAARLPSYVSS